MRLPPTPSSCPVLPPVSQTMKLYPDRVRVPTSPLLMALMHQRMYVFPVHTRNHNSLECSCHSIHKVSGWPPAACCSQSAFTPLYRSTLAGRGEAGRLGGRATILRTRGDRRGMKLANAATCSVASLRTLGCDVHCAPDDTSILRAGPRVGQQHLRDSGIDAHLHVRRLEGGWSTTSLAIDR